MNPYFYSLGMLVTRRTTDAAQDLPLSAMDLLAAAIADEEVEPSPLIAFLIPAPSPASRLELVTQCSCPVICDGDGCRPLRCRGTSTPGCRNRRGR